MKQQLLQYCQQYTDDRIKRFSSAISEAQSGANNETKSSAGDKHETGRAMAQLETENNARHLAEAKKLRAILSQITPEKKLEAAGLGAVVQTTGGNFFIAISAGKAMIDDQEWFLVSAATPIARSLLGKVVGETIVVRNQHHTITAIH